MNIESETLNSQPGTLNSKQDKNWRKLYSFVIAELVVLIIAFYAFMKLFS